MLLPPLYGEKNKHTDITGQIRAGGLGLPGALLRHQADGNIAPNLRAASHLDQKQKSYDLSLPAVSSSWRLPLTRGEKSKVVVKAAAILS